MDMDAIRESLSKAIGLIGDAGGVSAQNLAEMGEQQEKLLAIVVTVGDIFGDGLQLSDVAAVGKVVPDIMKLVKDLDWPGSDKKEFVIDAVWLVYKTVDTYPDGKQNNVNIPFLMGSWETKVERAFISFAAGMAVDAVFDRLRKDDEV
jgi:hypothetical protein